MRGSALAIVAITIFVAPYASADDPLYDPTCIDAENCVGPGTCTPDVCVPRACQPIVHCESDITSADDCAVNATIQGEICQGVVGVGGRTNGREDEAAARVALSDGHVDALNLPNTWTSPSAQLTFTTDEADLGTTSVGLYRSTINDDHEWRNVALVVQHGSGFAGGNGIIVGLRFLDGNFHGCYADVGDESARCPTQRELEEILP